MTRTFREISTTKMEAAMGGLPASRFQESHKVRQLLGGELGIQSLRHQRKTSGTYFLDLAASQPHFGARPRAEYNFIRGILLEDTAEKITADVFDDDRFIAAHKTGAWKKNRFEQV